MARKPIDESQRQEIYEIAVKQGWERHPKKVHDYFGKKAGRLTIEDGELDPIAGGPLKAETEAYANIPGYETIKKYLEPLRRGTLALKELRINFRFPRDMGPGENQIPWELAGFAGVCVGLYSKEFAKHPSIGLTRRYTQVAAYAQTAGGLSPKQIALRAEKLWFNDLLEGTS